jgi:hypothetical protein
MGDELFDFVSRDDEAGIANLKPSPEGLQEAFAHHLAYGAAGSPRPTI